MVDIFITDCRDRYDKSNHHDKILYREGFIEDCSFIDKAGIEDFNNSLVGLEDEASRLMLERLDEDTQSIIRGQSLHILSSGHRKNSQRTF
jgi:hypothetical protein